MLGHALDTPSSFSLFFFFFVSFLVWLSLIIHRKRLGNFSAICSCWIPVIVLQGVAQREQTSDEGFVVLNVIWLRLYDRPHIIRGLKEMWGGNGSVQPVKHAVLICRSKPPTLRVSLMLWDAVCSYLCLITIYVLFRLFAFDQTAAELFRPGRADRKDDNGKLSGCFSFKMQDQTQLERGAVALSTKFLFRASWWPSD